MFCAAVAGREDVVVEGIVFVEVGCQFGFVGGHDLGREEL